MTCPCVARRDQRLQADAAEVQGFVASSVACPHRQDDRPPGGDAAAGFQFELACCSNVVGMDVGVKRISELHAQLVESSRSRCQAAVPRRSVIACPVLLHNRGVGIGAGDRFEQLLKIMSPPWIV